MTAIWGSDSGDGWRLLTPSQYPAEKVLHDLVEQTPQMLPLAGSPQITVLGREVQLGAGRADLLAIENSGRLVIIEVKLFGNADARRAVVAQTLSYAAYMQGLHPTQLEDQILVPPAARSGRGKLGETLGGRTAPHRDAHDACSPQRCHDRPSARPNVAKPALRSRSVTPGRRHERARDLQ